MISQTEFEHGLSLQQMKVSQIIHAALALGVVAYLAVVLYLASQVSPDASGDEGILRMLSTVLIVSGLGAYTAGSILYTRLFNSISLHEPVYAQNGKVFKSVADIFVVRLRTADIVRLACFEGVAFFGLVICLLGSLNGVLLAKPIYWLAALPTFVVVGLVLLTFPTRQRIVSLFALWQERQGAGMISQ